MRYIIHDGEICDGSGEKPYKGDILLEGKVIRQIAKKDGVSGGISRDVEGIHIEAEGMTVTPGFIDTHRHCDIAALYDENLDSWNWRRGLQA